MTMAELNSVIGVSHKLLFKRKLSRKVNKETNFWFFSRGVANSSHSSSLSGDKISRGGRVVAHEQHERRGDEKATSTCRGMLTLKRARFVADAKT